MSTSKVTRKNAGLLGWLRAIAFATVTYWALAGPLPLAAPRLPFYPSVVAPIIALVVGALGLLAPAVGVLVFVAAIGLALSAANLLVGILFMVVGFSTIQYLGDDQGRAFLVITLAFLASLVHAEWAIVVLAGLLMGPGEGAIAAFIACLAIEIAGALFGAPVMGVLAVGGVSPALVDPAKLAALSAAGQSFTFGWVSAQVANMHPTSLLGAFTGLKYLILFVIQPFVWAGAAAFTGVLARPVGDPKRQMTAFASVGAGIAALAAVSAVLMLLLAGPIPISGIAVATAISLVVGLIAVAAEEFVFTAQAPAEARPASMSAEEADVDDLLRMISSAEEELTSKHTVAKTVMITDMKSFSRITQERGSVMTAKLVQRHRDLLLPIVEKAGGKGKSSGGDGLVAAFDDTGSALRAAVEMQRALSDYNAGRPGDEEILVRIGIASGEVVLDKGGKPFLGDALNLAARVMSLADGGQVFTTRAAADSAGTLPYGSTSHGEFRLKNISEPVEVVEVLWRDGQQGAAPHVEPPETTT
jgi:class 3 adenylate cyclase